MCLFRKANGKFRADVSERISGTRTVMPCYKPLGGWMASNGGITFVRPQLPSPKRTVACGQCLGCRLDKSREWAARIVHESEQWDQNCFITLTYRNEDECTERQFRKGLFVPPNGSLVKAHFQKFMKRLRKKFEGRRIRYYQCGEYGEKLDRPHYHACLFNLDFSDKELFKQEEGISLFVSEVLNDVWGYGYATVGSLSFDSAAYCARYVTKKVTGTKAQDYYLRCDDQGVAYWLEPEYSTMSRGGSVTGGAQLGGIGKVWWDEFKGDIFPSDECPIPGVGVVKKVPRYYTELLRKEDESEYDKVKDRRAAYLKAHIEEFSPERLEAKYRVARARFSLTNRSYENENECL